MRAVYKYELTKENILRFVNYETIYRRYLPTNFEFNHLFSSPFRKDVRPSFIIGSHSHNYRWKDFTTGESDDCFGFIMKLFSIPFNEALERIVIDLGLIENFIIYSKSITQSNVLAKYENVKAFNYETDIERVVTIKVRDWTQKDIDYWENMGVSQKMATIGRIVPIECYFVNGRYVQCGSLTFAYGEYKDEIWTFKIYSPRSKHKKWISYNNRSVVELWHLLPQRGKFLIITSSRKDSLAIIENLKIPSISFQGESVLPKPQIMKELKSRFEYIFLFYDNDVINEVDKNESNEDKKNWGQFQANKLVKLYPYLINIKTPDDCNSKDYSDLNKNTNRLQAKMIMQKIIRQEFDNHIKNLSNDKY